MAAFFSIGLLWIDLVRFFLSPTDSILVFNSRQDQWDRCRILLWPKRAIQLSQKINTVHSKLRVARTGQQSRVKNKKDEWRHTAIANISIPS